MTMVENQMRLTNINDELNRLWNQEQGEKKIRASLFSLILYVQKSDRIEYFQSLVKKVLSKFPCRVITIISDDQSTEGYLRTEVSSETMGEGDLQIFCEMIHIEVAGKLRERVPFLILPHILPDLPIYLLWTQDPTTENAVLPHLESIADRIIFDAESTENLQTFSRSVLSLIDRFHCEIGDLNWSALLGWRKLFTQVFSSSESLSMLSQSKTIRLVYNKSPTQFHHHTEIEAAYLQAWVASCMNWKFQSFALNEGNVKLSYLSPEGEIVILLIPQENPALSSGAILSIELESAKEKAHYVFKRHPKTRQVAIQYSDKERCDLPFLTVLAGNQDGEEILQEIFYPSVGEHYRNMLSTLSSIPWRSL